MKSNSSAPSSGARSAPSAYFLAGVMLFSQISPLLATLPQGARVRHGDVSFHQGGHQLNIQQGTQTAIVDWQGFSIGARESVNIFQPNAGAALLNRVVGADPSTLLGQIQANGSMFLINENGIVVGEDARIDTGAFFASTQQVSNADFLDGGNLTFEGDSTAGVVNLGQIRTSDGDAILVGHFVKNAGVIEAPAGTTGLAAGSRVVYTPATGGLSVEANLPATTATVGVENSGVIEAARARLEAAEGNLYELAVNQTGIVRATGVERRDGRILLTAQGGTVAQQGTLIARDSDGSGGEILVGGDYRGGNSDVANTDRTVVTADAVIDVAAGEEKADGGRAIVWADDATRFLGEIRGSGGALGGDGAFAEVSSGGFLDFRGFADLSASAGQAGRLLLDPNAITIADNGGVNADISEDDPFVFEQSDKEAQSILDVTVLEAQLAESNVVVETSRANVSSNDGGITVADPVSWASGFGLTLKSGTAIAINADVNAGIGNLTLLAGDPGFFLGGPDGPVIELAEEATLTANTLRIAFNTDVQLQGTGMNPPPGGALPGVDLAGAVQVETLQLDLLEDGFTGDFLADNPNNAIGTFYTEGLVDEFAAFRGNFLLVDGEGGLTVDALLELQDEDMTIVSAGDLTLAAGSVLATNGGGNITLASRTGSFINQAGAGGVAINDVEGRILVYSDHPTDSKTDLGGLALTPVYDKTYDANAPAGITATGDRVLYGVAPTLIVGAPDASMTYGGDLPTLSLEVSGLLGGDTFADATDGAVSISTTATADSDAGTYAIDLNTGDLVATDYNYHLQFSGDGELTINPAALTVTALNATRRAGLENPVFGAKIEGLVNGDTEAALTGLTITSVADEFSAPGEYAIAPSGITNMNYQITYKDAVLTVTEKLTLLIDVLDASRLYGESNPIFDANITGFESGDTEDIVSGLTFSVDADVSSDVGDYIITGSGATAGLAYNITYETGTLTINPAPLTIAADNFARAYGSDNPVLTASFAGLVADDVAGDFSNLSLGTTATADSDVGTYSITPSGVTNSNYTVTYESGTATVTPAPLTITIDNPTRLYREANPTLTADITGLVLGQTEADLKGYGLSTTADTESDVGAYPITASLGTNPNYAITVTDGTLTVNPQPLTLTVEDVQTTYGGAIPAFEYETRGTFNFYYDESSIALSSAATSGSDAGAYAITVTGADQDPNYDVTVVPGELTVNPAALTLRADNKTKVYGNANPTLTYTVGGLVNGDLPNEVVTDITLNTEADTQSDSGNYPIVIDGTLASDNYVLTLKDGNFFIAKRALAFIRPENVTRYYGDANPDEIPLYAEGFVNGDDTSDVNVILQYTAGAGFAPGVYSVGIIAASSPNYTFNTLGRASLIVKPRPLTISAHDATRVYGDPDPEFTGTISGLASFDDDSVITGLDFTTTAMANAGVGSWGIRPTSDPNPNYEITYEWGTLEITPAPVTIVSGYFSREYGDPMPEIGVEGVIGLKLDDTPNMLGLKWDAIDPRADVGSYEIGYTLSNPNYHAQAGGALLEVLPAPLAVDVDDVVRTYGELNPDVFGFQVFGLKTGDEPGDVINVPAPVDERGRVGDYNLIPELTTENYYFEDLEPGTLRILPRLLVLKPENVIKTYGDRTPEFDILVGGDGLPSFHSLEDFVAGVQVNERPNSEGAFHLLLPLDRSEQPLDDRMLGAGVYYNLLEMKPHPDLFGSGNYVLVTMPGAMTVMRRPVTIEVGDMDWYIGHVYPDPSIEVTNLPSFHHYLDAFPDLTYEVVETDTKPATELPVDPSEITYSGIYDDGTFAARYPSHAISAREGRPRHWGEPIDPPPPPPDRSGVIDFEVVPITFGAPEVLPAKPTSVKIVLLDSTLALPGGEKGPEDGTTIDYLRPVAASYIGNDNYLVTDVDNGTLTLRLTPEEQKKREIERMIDEAERAFEEGATVSGGYGYERRTFALGLSSPDMLRVLLHDALGGPDGDWLRATIQNLYMEKTGTTSEYDNELSDAEMALWLADIHTNAEKQALLMPFMAARANAYIGRDPGTLTPVEAAFVADFNRHLNEVRVELADRIAVKTEEYIAEMTASNSNPSLGVLFQNPEPDYPKIIKEVGIEFTKTSLAASALAGTAIGAAAGGAVAGGIAASLSTLAPFAVAKGTGIAATGALAGPFAIVAIAGVITTMAVIDLVDHENAKAKIASLDSPTSLQTITPEQDNGEADTIDTLLMMMALTSMVTGQ